MWHLLDSFFYWFVHSVVPEILRGKVEIESQDWEGEGLYLTVYPKLSPQRAEYNF